MKALMKSHLQFVNPMQLVSTYMVSRPSEDSDFITSTIKVLNTSSTQNRPYKRQIVRGHTTLLPNKMNSISI